MTDSSIPGAALAVDLSIGTAHLPGREVLDRAALRAVTARSDLQGLLHWAGHCLAILVTHHSPGRTYRVQ